MDDKNYKTYLLKYIDEVLHYIWDPIGVSDTPEARDEYSSYAWRVYNAVLKSKDLAEIAAILSDIEVDMMGYELTEKMQQKNEKVAEIILDWARYLKDDMSTKLIDQK